MRTCGRQRSRCGWSLGAFLGVACGVLALAGCASEYSGSNAAPARAVENHATLVGGPGQAKDVSTDSAALSRKIIYNATVDLVAERLSTAETALVQLVKAQGGYVAENEVTGSPGSPRQGSWKVRIPVSRFEPFMAGVTRLGELQKQHVDSQDVSEEYYDLQARLSNKRVEEQRLLDHLRNSTARLQDVLAVEKEVSRVRGEVEQLQGRIRFLSNRTDLATVTVTISEVKEFLPADRTTFSAQVGRTFHESVRLMGDAAKVVILTLVALAPWLAVAAVPGLILWAILRRRARAAASISR